MALGIPCRHCARYKEGKYNLCADMALATTPSYDGTLAKYYVFPEGLCYKLPGNVNEEEGALGTRAALRRCPPCATVTTQTQRHHRHIWSGSYWTALLCGRKSIWCEKDYRGRYTETSARVRRTDDWSPWSCLQHVLLAGDILLSAASVSRKKSRSIRWLASVEA